MVALRDTAHITVEGRRLSIEAGEPLEDSVRTVHRVMLMIARRTGERTKHEGRQGYRAPLNLTRTVQDLTMDLGENDRKVLSRMISQVFRQTGAAKCLVQADPHTHADPVWFVADELPENLIVIVGYVRGKSAESMSRPPTAFDEKSFLRPGEKRLLPEEVGETLPAGEVTVTTTAEKPKKRTRKPPKLTPEQIERRTRVLEPFHEETRRRHAELTEQAYEMIATAPVPMSVTELTVILNRELGTDWNSSTIRTVLQELKAAGRIDSRPETREERLIRGGGTSPKAKGPAIWHLPGEDAPRTRLPDGIEPIRPAADWAAEKKMEKRSLMDRVYAVLDVPNRASKHAPRTLGQIARAADLAESETKAALDQLVRQGKVFHHPKHNYWTPMNRATESTLAKYGNGNGNGHQPAPYEAVPVTAAEVRAKVIQAMDVPNMTGAPAPRTVGRIAEKAGLTKNITRRVLQALVRDGLVYFARNSQTYTPMNRVRPGTLKKAGITTTTAEVPPTPDTPASVTVTYQPTAPAPEAAAPAGDRAALAGQIIDLVRDLAEAPANGDTAFLKAEIERLEQENDRLRAAVLGLRQTLAALD